MTPLPRNSRIALEAGTLSVRHTLDRVKGAWLFAEPKSERSRRTIKIPAPLVPILRTHRTAQLKRRLGAGGRWQEHDFVFTTRNGRPLDGCSLTRDTKGLLRKAGLPLVSFHALRHSFATLLLVQGVSPRVVMDLLGHSDIRLTLDVYSHVIPTLQDDAAAKIGAALWRDA